MAGQPPYHNLVLYSFGTPNGLKPAIVLEELGLTYKTETVDISKNTQKEPWFLEINPNGRIPALKDGDMRIFESGAMMLYLTDHYDPENKIGYKHGQANHFRAMAGAYSAYGIKRYSDETKRLIDVLESRLSKADWLAGDKYTLADIANFAWVRAAPIILEFDLSAWPGVDKWAKRIAERPAVQKAKKVPDSGRTDEQVEAMFKSMRERVDAMKGTEKQDS